MKHQAGTFGKVVLSEAGVYGLMAGAGWMSCPTGWAAKIHAGETQGDDRQFVVYLNSTERKLLFDQLRQEAEHEKRSIQQQIWRVLEERYSEVI